MEVVTLKNKIYLDTIAPATTKPVKNKYIPTISTIEETIYAGEKKGKTFKIENAIGLKITIDNFTVGERDLYKLFPTRYKEFHYSISGKPNPKTGDLNKIISIYFPKKMIIEHNITVSYRIKMQQYIFTLIENTSQS